MRGLGKWKWIGAAILLVVGFVVTFQNYPLYTETWNTCSRCRAIETDTYIFGHSWKSTKASDYTKWFDATHTTHTHHWCWNGSYNYHYVLGIEYACGQSHPIWKLFAKFQQKFVESSSAADIQKFYAIMDSTNYDAQMAAVESVNDAGIAKLSAELGE